MTRVIEIHAAHPQPRLLSGVVEAIRAAGVIVYPTDSCYALGCRLGEKAAMERIRRIRRPGPGHHFSLVCRDLSELATYAKVSNSAFRLLRACTPGPYTFILQATREVPRRLQHPRRRSIGLRVPDHPVVSAMLERLGEPIMSSTLLLPGEDLPLADRDEIKTRLRGQVEVIVDAGPCGVEPTTVVDMTGDTPNIVRKGKGSPAPFLP